MADYTLSAKLTADSRGLQRGFEKAQQSLANLQSKTSSFGKKFQDLGRSIKGVGDTLTRKITMPAVAATGALTGITLVKGFNRLTGIDTAQAKLKGLGHDGKNVEEIMNSALESVLGTSYGMDEAVTTAASAVAAGVNLGDDLTRYLSLTGDAAAIAGDSMADMGTIFNKVQTANRAYTMDLNMLSERGIPIYQWIAAEAGTTAEAVRNMASDGEISSEMFLNAIEKNIGGAAKTMGEESFMAGIANIGAAISRLGANFLDAGGEAGGFFSTIKPLIPEVISFIDGLADQATGMGTKFGNAFNNFIDKAIELKGWFDNLSPPVQNLITKTLAIGSAVLIGLGPALRIVGMLTSGFGTLATIASFLFSPIGLIAGAIIGLGVAFTTAMIKSEDFRQKVFSAFEKVREIVTNVVSLVGPVLSNLWEGARDGVSSFAEGLGGKLLNAFEIISDVVLTVVDVIGEFVSSVIGGFKDAGGEVSNLSMLFFGFNPVLKLVMTILKDFGPQIASAFSEIASMAVPLLTLLGQTLGELAAAIIPMVMNVISILIPIVVDLGTTIMQIVSAVLPILIDLFTQLVPIVMSLVTTVIDLVGQLLPLASTIIDALLPVVTMLIETFMHIVEMVAPALIAIIGAVISIFQAVIPVVMSILTVVVNVMANVIAAITPIIAFITTIISTIIGIIAPIVTFIAGIISSIFSVITPIVSFTTGVFNTVFNIISSIFRNILNTISGVIRSATSVISTLSGVVSRVFNKISNIVTSVMDRVNNIITRVFSAIQNSWSGLTGFVSGVFSGIEGAVTQLTNQVKRFVNGVIGGVNAAIGIINKIPGVNIGKIPQLYRGTDDWAGGFAYMNEGGRGEMVMLPSGSQVIPHDVSMKYAREAGRQSGRPVGAQTNSDNHEPRMLLDAVNTFKDSISNLGFYVNDEQIAVVTNDAHDRINGTKVNLDERWDR